MRISHLVLFLTLMTTQLMFARSTHASTYADLTQQMAQGCPVAWEDLAVAINSSLPAGDLWANDAADRSAFVAIYAAQNPDFSAAQVEADADNLTIVAAECASFRLAVLEELLAQTSLDIDAATTEAGNSGLIQLSNDGFLTGDVRMTGRPTAAAGWVFLVGQSIGGDASGADLKGVEYEDLFELAKTWAPNAGTENFAAGDSVVLPDMRGRGVYGADNMGGTAANTLTAAGSGVVGSNVGQESQTLSVDQLPSHTHTMQGAGSHNHTLTSAGSHQHKLRTSIWEGSGVGQTQYHYFRGRARPDYHNTIQQNAVRPAGNHTHGMNDAGSHQHTIDATGGGQPVTTVSPGLIFNVEMKL